MNELQIIEQREVLGKDFKIYGDIENPLFLAKDVAEWIEHSNPSKMITDADLPEEEIVKKMMGTITNSYSALFLTEDGLYEVLMQSRKPIAKKFKAQVKEILRSIRKHGAYMTPAKIEEVLQDPDTIIRLATVLKEEQAKNNTLAVENAKQKQIIGELGRVKDYIDQILSSPGTMAITQIAADYNMSANRLNKILRDEGIQWKVNGQWILYAEHMEKGWTKSNTIPITRTSGKPDTIMHTQWTQRGRLHINEILNRRGIYANADFGRAA